MLGRRTGSGRRTEREKMNRRELISLFVLFAGLTLTTADGDEVNKHETSNLYIDGTTVTLFCPEEPTKWKKDGADLVGTDKNLTISNYKDENNGFYQCGTEKNKYYFYTKLKVCVDCVDLDMGWATAIVIGDILVTLGVILIVYLCAKKKAGPAPRQRATPGRQAGAPPPPNPDYQVLNPATRSRDVYAEAVRKH
ncbi:T-cell surface glycoprotein CD3 epsilon chain [Pygocentrus nattereri]|uniref:CD3 gamma/delta subunit Ig-like domain-containing protein n=1 Tax=Pygocentrus nattereri TaxID=42514 RepID=A0A3B4ENS2_PYGNA|nr:T-cell surface glycoprotein CD3 epsilon chain [Pygocentrus nattereri]